MNRKSVISWRLPIIAVVVLLAAVLILITLGKSDFSKAQPLSLPKAQEFLILELPLLDSNYIGIVKYHLDMLKLKLKTYENFIEQYKMFMEWHKDNPERIASYQELIRQRESRIEELQNEIKAAESWLEQVKNVPKPTPPIIVGDDFSPPLSLEERKQILLTYLAGLLKTDAQKLRSTLKYEGVGYPDRFLLTEGNRRYLQILENLIKVFENSALELEADPSSLSTLEEMKTLLEYIDFLKTQAPLNNLTERGYYRLTEELGKLLEKRLKQLERCDNSD